MISYSKLQEHILYYTKPVQIMSVKKQIKRIIYPFSFLLGLLLIQSGCTTQLDDLVPGHKLHVQQGNVISPDMIKQLKIGMNKQQAKYILGSPVLENVLESNEYTYIYTEQNATKNFHERKLILSFNNRNELVSIKGSGIKKDNIGKYYLSNDKKLS